MTATTTGLVCAHHHLYSALARGMPAPPRSPHDFHSILEQIWWRVDAALDNDIIYWSAALGAAEALLSGTTTIIDHHESPNSIEGSLDAIAAGCALIGVRVVPSYGVTDRWSDDGRLVSVDANGPMSDGARRGLKECQRFITEHGRGMVGVHASFTCTSETLEAAADLFEPPLLADLLLAPRNLAAPLEAHPCGAAQRGERDGRQSCHHRPAARRVSGRKARPPCPRVLRPPAGWGRSRRSPSR